MRGLRAKEADRESRDAAAWQIKGHLIGVPSCPPVYKLPPSELPSEGAQV